MFPLSQVIIHYDGYFLQSCAKIVKVKLLLRDKVGGLKGNYIPCTDPVGVHSGLVSDDKVDSGALRTVHTPLGVHL